MVFQLLVHQMYLFRLVPNCVIKAKTVRNRVYVGDEIDECKDLSGLYYLLAFQKVSNYCLFASTIFFSPSPIPLSVFAYCLPNKTFAKLPNNAEFVVFHGSLSLPV